MFFSFDPGDRPTAIDELAGGKLTAAHFEYILRRMVHLAKSAGVPT